VIETARLILRPWREADRASYAAMMADPKVGYWLGGALGETRANAQVDRFMADSGAGAPGFLALERRDDGAFLGAACLRAVPADHPLAGEVEIGWRLAPSPGEPATPPRWRALCSIMVSDDAEFLKS
jgi:RimJ/RimL family protein N-acetyltransferase